MGHWSCHQYQQLTVVLCKEMDSKKLPSFHKLKSEAVIQFEVAKRMHLYDHIARSDPMRDRGTDVLLESGKFRAGTHKVRKVFPWSQDFCEATTSKQPMHDGLSALHWAQDMISCALDELKLKLTTKK